MLGQDKLRIAVDTEDLESRSQKVRDLMCFAGHGFGTCRNQMDHAVMVVAEVAQLVVAEAEVGDEREEAPGAGDDPDDPDDRSPAAGLPNLYAEPCNAEAGCSYNMCAAELACGGRAS